jgi:hypothetical protein
MEQIDDLNGSGKVIFGDVPDPFCAIADDDLLFGTTPATLPGLDVEPFAKPLGGFNRTAVGGGVGSPG